MGYLFVINVDGNRPLRWATDRKDYDMVELMCKHGAHIDSYLFSESQVKNDEKMKDILTKYYKIHKDYKEYFKNHNKKS